MADQIPLRPVRSAASRKRAAYYSAAGRGPGAERPSRSLLEDEYARLDEMPLMMSEEGCENDEGDYHTLPRAGAARRRRRPERALCGGWQSLCSRSVARCACVLWTEGAGAGLTALPPTAFCSRSRKMPLSDLTGTSAQAWRR